MSAKLLIDGPGAWIYHYSLHKDRISIGRHESNLLKISDPGISGRHAEIVKEGDSWIIRDLGSTNGVSVNGQKVPEAALFDQDQIRIGSSHLIFQDPKRHRMRFGGKRSISSVRPKMPSIARFRPPKAMNPSF